MYHLKIGSHNYTQVVVLDDPHPVNNAHHKYAVTRAYNYKPEEGCPSGEFEGTTINFQNGPIKEFGVNGCHHEDLLTIVQHRLESFQEGPYECPENAQALAFIKSTIAVLNSRTQKRVATGVEGTSNL